MFNVYLSSINFGIHPSRMSQIKIMDKDIDICYALCSPPILTRYIETIRIIEHVSISGKKIESVNIIPFSR